ncbi:MAG: SpoIIE family protein phosphatase [Microcoleaceae cyanobacterium]
MFKLPGLSMSKQLNFPFSKSLRFRLVAVTLLVVVPPVTVGWLFLKKQANNYLYDDAKQDLQRGAESFAVYVKDWQQEQLKTLELIKRVPFIQSQDQELKQNVLQRISAFLPTSSFDIVNWEGDAIATTDADVANYADRAWFKAIKEEQKAFGQQTLIGRVSKRPRQCFSTGLINPEQEDLSLVLALCIDLKLVAENLQQEIQSAAPQSRGFVVSRNGILIADSSENNYTPLEERRNYPPVAAALQGKTGYFSFESNGNQILSRIVQLDNGWIVIVEKDKELVFEKANFFDLVATVLGGITIILIAGGTWYISGHITRPILELATATNKLSEGDLETRVQVRHTDEIGTLATNFNSMAAQLHELIEAEVSEAIARNEIEKGRQIQQDFLPESIPLVPGWEIAYYFQPAREVSGDFYDAFTFSNGDVGFVIADVCDKGVGAAMFMGLFRSFIRLFSDQTDLETPTPAQVDSSLLSQSNQADQTIDEDTINRLQCIPITNNYIGTEHGNTVMFATTFFGILSPKTGIVSYINGGHEPVFVINTNGEIKHTLNSTGPAVGMMPMSKFMIKQVQLEPGDILIGYTDGVLDARNPDKKLFGKERLQTLLCQPFDSASELIDRIKTDLFNHIADAAQFDDITMLAIRHELQE